MNYSYAVVINFGVLDKTAYSYGLYFLQIPQEVSSEYKGLNLHTITNVREKFI